VVAHIHLLTGRIPRFTMPFSSAENQARAHGRTGSSASCLPQPAWKERTVSAKINSRGSVRVVHRETLEERLQRGHCVRRRRIEESTLMSSLRAGFELFCNEVLHNLERDIVDGTNN